MLFPHDKNDIRLTEQYQKTQWDVSTGLSYEQLVADCKTIADTPHATYAAALAEQFAYILDNGRLEYNPANLFADKICGENIIASATWQRRRIIDAEKMQKTLADAREICRFGDVIPSTDFGHIAPDWDYLMEKGIVGVIADLEICRQSATFEHIGFYDCSLTVWNAIRRYVLRLEVQKRREGLSFTADTLAALASHSPQTLAQAMQLTVLIYRLQTNMEGDNVRSLGRLDRLYDRFYESDLANGVTEEELADMTAHFLYKFYTMKVTANIPFALGGVKADGSDACNPFTMFILRVYDSLNIDDPKIHFFWHKNIDSTVMRYIYDMIRRGHSSFVFINCEVVEEALQRIGETPEDARDFIVYGCYETASSGREIPATCGGQVNITRAFMMTMDSGKQFDSYEAFFADVRENLIRILDVCMDTIAAWEPYYADIHPSPLLSATFASCREKGLDVFCGGAKYNNTSIVVACIASLTDMLLGVKETVYDKKLVTLDGLREILRNNWAGYEQLQQYLRKFSGYGSHNEYADRLAAALSSDMANRINNRPNGRGGIFRCGMFSIDWRFRFGKNMGATPDGRSAGEQLSKNFCTCPGRDFDGVTALIHSASHIDGREIPDGAVLDVVLHPTAVQGEEGLNVINSLLLTYFAKHGFSIQFNVFDPTILRKAQQTPEKYRNLQVRLCGWNVYFVDLTKAEQDEFIRQAEAAG